MHVAVRTFFLQLGAPRFAFFVAALGDALAQRKFGSKICQRSFGVRRAKQGGVGLHISAAPKKQSNEIHSYLHISRVF